MIINYNIILMSINIIQSSKFIILMDFIIPVGSGRSFEGSVVSSVSSNNPVVVRREAKSAKYTEYYSGNER
jgi:ABC-type methionine transport system permease subunit